jgi:hypothetical protein
MNQNSLGDSASNEPSTTSWKKSWKDEFEVFGDL